MNATQKEAQEIITNVTRDYRAGRIEFWQWWDVTRSALRDGFMSAILEAKSK